MIKRLALFCLFTALPLGGQSQWTWKDSHGDLQQQAELTRILSDHKIWVESKGSAGKRAEFVNANLSGANLRGVNLRGADFTLADLTGADLTNAELSEVQTDTSKGVLPVGTDFTKAVLFKTTFSGANLTGAHFDGGNIEAHGAFLLKADLDHTNLTHADFTNADLTRADLTAASLREADFSNAILRLATYQPKDPTELVLIVGARGLDQLTYTDDPEPIHDLRNAFRDAGFTQPERETNEALHRHRPTAPTPIARNTQPGWDQLMLWRVEELQYWLQVAQYWFQQFGFLSQQALFDWPCGWGAEPGRPLIIIAVIALLCTPIYWVGLHSRFTNGGLFLVSTGQRIATAEAKQRVFRITVGSDNALEVSPQPHHELARRAWMLSRRRARRKKYKREFRALRTALLFSMMSVFNIGFNGFNGGLWIRMLQPREFDIRARGWMRIISGVQSLLGVGLLALAVLSYFGHPFE